MWTLLVSNMGLVTNQSEPTHIPANPLLVSRAPSAGCLGLLSFQSHLLLLRKALHPCLRFQKTRCGCLFRVEFWADSHRSKAERGFPPTQMGTTLKTTSQHPCCAAALESGHDLFPLPQVTAAKRDAPYSRGALRSYSGHSPGLLRIIKLGTDF